MPTSPSVVQAVQAAIVASAHLAAFEHVAAAAQACQRLGSLTSGRWRSAARDLDALEEDLQTAFATAAEVVTSSAEEIGIPEDALWSVGDAAGTLDLLRGAALEEVETESRAAQVLQGQVLFGASFVEDPDLPGPRGNAAVRMARPAVASNLAVAGQLGGRRWPGQRRRRRGERTGPVRSRRAEGDESMLGELAEELSCSRQEARTALREAALALTRASLLAGAADDDEDEDVEDETSNGEP